MKVKIMVSSIIIIVFIIFGAYSFFQSNIEYMDFNHAKAVSKKVQVKGEWIQERGSQYSPGTNQFIFFMKDENNNEMKVLLDGAKPNNFEVATSIVVKGKYEGDYFHANEVLTKCPSKYEAQGTEVKKTS